MTAQATDPLVAWVTATPHDELERFRDWYATRYPPPPADCSAQHSAFGPGCPWCSPRTTPQTAAGRDPHPQVTRASRRAPRTQKASQS